VKRSFMMLVLFFLMATTSFAYTRTIVRNTVVEEEKNQFDYGAYLDLIAIETPSTEWGLHTTYTTEDSDMRVYVGGKIYLNRLLKKK